MEVYNCLMFVLFSKFIGWHFPYFLTVTHHRNALLIIIIIIMGWHLHSWLATATLGKTYRGSDSFWTNQSPACLGILKRQHAKHVITECESLRVRWKLSVLRTSNHQNFRFSGGLIRSLTLFAGVNIVAMSLFL